MTDPTPAPHGCMIDGQPAMPILISEYNQLIARATEAEAKVLDYENRITWHTTCESCARILDSSIRETERAVKAEAAVERVRSLLPPAEFDHDQTLAIHPSHIRTALDEPGPAATQATDGICSDPASETEPNNRWLLAGSRDLSIPQHLPKFTAVHVTPEMERAATERARQMAEAHEQAEKPLVLAFEGADADGPSCVGCGHHDGEGCGCPPAPAVDPLRTRVTALYEQWVKAGPPPLGVSLARWWDKRLVELRNAINTVKET